MTNCLAYGVPIVCFVFLAAFSTVLLRLQARSTNDKKEPTKEHSERIYKDYDLYLKVILALVAGFGYVRFERVEKSESLAREAMLFIGGIGLLVMLTFSIFVICHLGSKLRRWEIIEWNKAFFWQELWACLSMWLFSSALWIAAIKW